MKRKFIIMLAIVASLNLLSINTFASELKNNHLATNTKNFSNSLDYSRLEIFNEDTKEYNDKFKIDNSLIKRITSNGGHYASSTEDKSIDNDINTHYETGKPNKNNFTNELLIEFKEAITIDRITYVARQSANNKGFLEEYEIYSSENSSGNDFTLLTHGTGTPTSKKMQIKFNPTNCKRIKIKFIKAKNDWAAVAELGFYKEDKLLNEVNKIFTDKLLTKISPEYSNITILEDLKNKVESHPLKEDLLYKINLAIDILNNKVDINNQIFTPKQVGNIEEHASKNLLINYGSNLQTLGLYATPGEQITVYVDVENESKLPQLVATQHIGRWNNWRRNFKLHPGKNVITIPEIYDSNWTVKTNKGGPLYIENPYTQDEQGTIKIRIEGGHKYPVFKKGDDIDKFKKELEEFQLKCNSDTTEKVIDVVEFVGKNEMLVCTTNGAYNEIITKGKNPQEILESWDEGIENIKKFYGLDDNGSIKNNGKNLIETIRVMQPYAYMYAYSNHIGYQINQQSDLLDPNAAKSGSWGFFHEIGHNFDLRPMTWGEITNNLVPLNQRVTEEGGKYYQTLEKLDRIPWSDIYNYSAPDDKQTEKPTFGGFGMLGAPFWQLELFYPGYWGELAKYYRENGYNFNPGNVAEKEKALIKNSSDIMKVDLTQYFERVGFIVDEETKSYCNKYKPLDKKIWYLNSTARFFKGKGYNNDVIPIARIANEINSSNVVLNFDIAEENTNSLLGYEISKNGKVIGFTKENSFTVPNSNRNEEAIYEVIAYAKDLSKTNAIEIKSKTPTILSNEKITLKLNEEFNPLEYVNAFDHLGNKIDTISVDHNVDTSKKGNYNVTYNVTSNDITVTKNTTVEVVSDYNYLSDSEWNSAKTDYSTIRKDNDLNLFVNGEVKSFDKGFGIHANGEIVYDLSGYDYDKFETFIGVSRSISEQNKSSIIFSIVADGKEIYNSGLMKYSTPAKHVSLDIKGVKELKIVINDANNGISSDHAVIANPILTSNNVKPTLTIGKDESIELRSQYNLRDSIFANDIEDGNLTNSIVINDNGFTTDKAGEYTIEYSVTDYDGNTTNAEKKVLVYSERNYLSDIDWKFARTDYGSVRKDKASSNVNMKLLVDGEVKEFNKGIGTHANSEIVYNLENTNYQFFETYIGIDRNIKEQNDSSVIFKIYADGKEVYNSGLMKYNTDAKFVRIPIDGVKELKLVANNADNGNYSDHANFADAKLLTTNSIPKLNIPKSISTNLGQPIDINQEYSATDIEDGDLTESVKVEGTVNFDKTGEYPITYTVVDNDGNKVSKSRTIAVVDMNDFTYLTDYNWKTETHSYSAPKKDLSISSKSLRLTDENGKEVTYDRGIGSHSTATIIYDLSDKNYDYFTSYVGVDRNVYGTIGSVCFEVYVDGEKKFDSGLMNSKDSQKFIKVDINGAKELKLVVTDGGNGKGSDHATWGYTKLHYANENGTSINRSELDNLIQTITELNSSIYTQESFNNLTIILDEVKNNLTDGYNQEEIDNLYNKLKGAFDALIKVTDFSKLEEVIAKNTNLNELHYYKDAITAHNLLVEKAKEILANENSTQEEIDAIVAKINESSKNLVVRENKVELENKIKEAKTIENNNYIPIRWDNFQWAIGYASDIYNNIDSTDEEVKSALFTLEYMKNELA